MKILMVCLGNICRSPLAEGILKQRAAGAGLSWHIESAGTNGFNMGIAPHHLSQKVALLNGFDICDQRARQFTAGDFSRFDKIYALAEDVLDDIKAIAGKEYDGSRVDLLMNECYPGQDMDVPDPWSGTESGFHKAFDQINEACKKIIEKYAATTAQAQASRPISAPHN